MGAAATVREYYDALRGGEPLFPFFLEAETTVKFGLGERLDGYESVAAGLREQTATTRDWAIDSRDLVVVDRDCHAWFSDEVVMAWTDAETGDRREYDSRWSGTLERTDEGWRFATMHVSAGVDR